ncbi:MAG: low molecular weight protein arginine phosphatase [Candidatus Omnitrophota bacterium]
MIRSILLVCTGNSCRSAMAEGLLRKLLRERGCKEIKIFSAGIAAVPGMMASANAIEVMAKEGADISNHRSSSVTKELIKQADLVLCMEPLHLQAVLNFDLEAKDKTYLLLDYAYEMEEDKPANFYVTDPVGKPLEVYESVLMTLREAMERLVKRICV